MQIASASNWQEQQSADHAILKKQNVNMNKRKDYLVKSFFHTKAVNYYSQFRLNKIAAKVVR